MVGHFPPKTKHVKTKAKAKDCLTFVWGRVCLRQPPEIEMSHRHRMSVCPSVRQFVVSCMSATRILYKKGKRRAG